jgi:hypothetical protein
MRSCSACGKLGQALPVRLGHAQVICECGLKGPMKRTSGEAEEAWDRRIINAQKKRRLYAKQNKK